MMRVLYLSAGIDTPGHLLVRALASCNRVQIKVLTSCGEAREKLAGIVLCEEFSSRGKLDFGAIGRLRQKVTDGQFDVIQATSSRLLANALLATRRMPGATKVVGFAGFMGKFYNWHPEHRLTYLNPRLAAICCNCQAVLRQLARCGVPQSKLHTVYAAYEFAPSAVDTSPTARCEIGIPKSAFVVGFVGNMRRVKGADLLLQAAIELAHDTPIHWLLLGRVEDRRVKRLASHPAIASRVHLPGFRPDTERFMRAMDVFVMPSRSEGMSRAIMEAMSLGICPIVTNVGGSAELVRHMVDGIVLPPGDSTAIASAIQNMRRQPAQRKAFAAAARQRIQTAFNVRQMVDSTLAMYRSLTDGDVVPFTGARPAVPTGLAPVARRFGN